MIDTIPTTVPQLIHILLTGVALLVSTGAIWYAYRTKQVFYSHKATTSAVSKLRREVAECIGSVADLEERFTRFQKKEGMRVARSAKEREQELAEEARQLMADAGPDQNQAQGKLGLYNRIRGH